ncbi:MAG: XRE family transcriptional regulator [Actinobacteria bacterium]|nr:XRE family transcriptional regulator [Actinomycetota bacterium]
MDIGPRIKLARAKAQMSLRELADQVGVSATAISKFERGEATPRQSTLLRLAKALSVSIEYFFREIKVETLAPAYRKHSELGKRVQDGIEAIISEAVERYLTTEQLFPKGFFPEGKLARFPAKMVADAEKAAEVLREEWNLGSDPIEDLCGRLENHGVKVIELDGPNGFDGFSCWVNGLVPVIAFNANVPADRQRFDMAHELGHLVLDPDPSTDVEKVAHRFAAAFLVPARAAYAELGRKRSNLSFDELLLLKREYGLSIQAWMRRALDLGIIDQTIYSMLYRRLSARGWRIQEPNGVSKEEPRRLQLLVHQALAENLITPSFAATLLGDTPTGQSQQANTKLSEPTDALAREYSENRELTAFMDVDLEDFYEEDR